MLGADRHEHTAKRLVYRNSKWPRRLTNLGCTGLLQNRGRAMGVNIDGHRLKFRNVIDAQSCLCLAIRVDRHWKAKDVVAALGEFAML